MAGLWPMFPEEDYSNHTALIENAHRAAVAAPFWDVVEATDRAALFYAQLRRKGVPQVRARAFALLQFASELVSGDDESGLRFSRASYLTELKV